MGEPEEGKPHDRMFFEALRRPEDVRAFLRELLPADMKAFADFESIAPVRGRFVDAALRDHLSDLLFTLRIRGEEHLLYVLLEHLRSPRFLMPWDLLGYVMQVLAAWRREHPDECEFPRVLPIVVLQGDRPYGGPTRVIELFRGGPAEPFAGPGPEFQPAVVDLARVADARLLALAATGAAFAGLALLLMKHVGSDDLSVRLREWADMVRQAVAEGPPRWAMDRLLRYVALAARDDRAPQVIAELIPEGKELYMTLADKLRREGLERGLEQGERLAQVRSLRKVLELRFGALNPEIDRRIESADIPALQGWFDRALTARALAEVFSPL
jgi:hypothetical protein